MTIFTSLGKLPLPTKSSLGGKSNPKPTRPSKGAATRQSDNP